MGRDVPEAGVEHQVQQGSRLLKGAMVGLCAVLAICTIGLVNALVWYGRLHYRLLKPALEPQTVGGIQ